MRHLLQRVSWRSDLRATIGVTPRASLCPWFPVSPPSPLVPLSPRSLRASFMTSVSSVSSSVPSASAASSVRRTWTHRGDKHAAETLYFVGVFYAFEKLSLPSTVIRNRLASQFPIDGRRLVRFSFIGVFQCKMHASADPLGCCLSSCMQACVFVYVALLMNFLLLFDRRPLPTEKLAANIERLITTNRPKSTTRTD